MFLRYQNESPSAVEIEAYCQRLTDLKLNGCQIAYVQIYTVARTTAEAAAKPLTKDEVDSIVQQVRALGITAEAYYGPG